MSEETEERGHEIDPGVSVGNLPAAMIDVINERRRQILEEGFTPAGDDAQADGAMARAAGCYAIGPQFIMTHPMGDGAGNILDVPVNWPWPPVWWKPRSRREDLVRSGALIIAEIERIDRAEAGQAAPPPALAPLAGNGWGE